MEAMFEYATSFNGDLSKWQVGHVRTMATMFFGATSFDGDLSKWQVGNVEKIDGMFAGADNVSSVGRVDHVFAGVIRMTQCTKTQDLLCLECHFRCTEP